MNFSATKAPVSNRGIPPDEFLAEMVNWAKTAPDEIFVVNSNPADIFSYIAPQLADPHYLAGDRVVYTWPDLMHRKAAMLEALRVLAGFESSWNWQEGVDTTNPTSDTPETMEAGAWQVSANSRVFGGDLQSLYLVITMPDTSVFQPDKNAGSSQQSKDILFQWTIKNNHKAAMEWISRLLRHTVKANGPALRREINPWLSRDAQAEFVTLLQS